MNQPNVLYWIMGSGFCMSAIALVGSLTLIVSKETLDRSILPLVSFAAGSMLTTSLFIFLPESIEHLGNETPVFISFVSGFLMFFVLEQFLHWHHCHHSSGKHRPLTYLVLISDGIHNFIAGLAVASAFMIDIRVGITAWIAEALHEVPQELGDFGILIHGGWERKRALIFNFISALTFPFAGLVVYFLSQSINVSYLLPFAAGNFLYIAAVDLIPEIKNHASLKTNMSHFIFFLLGMALLFSFKMWMGHQH
ncbi:MAG: ZIP family metal transporter [Bdellovibrionales bacterium]|nr:ZIP family metal transporter [Bdellovibrionales bacterium]